MDEKIAWVRAYAEFHSDTWSEWRSRGRLYCAWRLIQEVSELVGVILGVHDDDLDHELRQIASICLNWLEDHA